MPSWFSHFPSTSDGRKGSEIEILIFRQICILALCSKTSEGPWHPLDITFLEFFCIFITFGSKWLRKTSGWWGFQKIWHLGHPIEGRGQVNIYRLEETAKAFFQWPDLMYCDRCYRCLTQWVHPAAKDVEIGKGSSRKPTKFEYQYIIHWNLKIDQVIDSFPKKSQLHSFVFVLFVQSHLFLTH